jgi:hypothetical protein
MTVPALIPWRSNQPWLTRKGVGNSVGEAGYGSLVVGRDRLGIGCRGRMGMPATVPEPWFCSRSFLALSAMTPVTRA